MQHLTNSAAAAEGKGSSSVFRRFRPQLHCAFPGQHNCNDCNGTAPPHRCLFADASFNRFVNCCCHCRPQLHCAIPGQHCGNGAGPPCILGAPARLLLPRPFMEQHRDQVHSHGYRPCHHQACLPAQQVRPAGKEAPCCSVLEGVDEGGVCGKL